MSSGQGSFTIPPPPPYASTARKSTSKVWVAIAISAMLLFALVFFRCGSSFTQANAVSRSAVERFHAQLNREEYQAIFTQSDPKFQEAAPPDQTIKFLGAVHRKLGNAGEFSFRHINITATTSGKYIVAQYATRFDKDTAIEAFTWRELNGQLRLVGYNVNSTKLVTE